MNCWSCWLISCLRRSISEERRNGHASHRRTGIRVHIMQNAGHSTTKSDKLPAIVPAQGRVVAAVYSAGTLSDALALPPPPAAPDWLELRVDGFHARPEVLDELVARAPRPFVLTVRHPAEGGAEGAPADARSRRSLYGRFLACGSVAAVDVEVRSLRALAQVAREAKATGRLVVASFHDFGGVPPTWRLRERATRAAAAGADVFKLAATVERPGQLARLLDFMAWGRGQGLPLAVMGMGSLGRVSRLALATAGSVLNYGYLGEGGPQVPGQWPAAVLRERIEECRRGNDE